MGFLSALAVLSTLGLGASADPAKPQPAITALRITPDGKGILIGSQAGVRRHDFNGKDPMTIETKLDQVLAIAFSQDGKTVAIAGGSPAERGVVELRSWPAGKLLGQLEGHVDVVHDVVWLAEQKRWATASADRTVRIWDGEQHQCLQTLKGHSGPVFALAVSPDGKLLCSASGDHTIRVWNGSSWKLERSLNNHLGAVHGLAFQPSQKDETARLASVSEDKSLRIWQPDIGRLVRIVRHPCPVYGLAWNPDGTRILTGGKDGKLRLFEGDSDKLLDEKQLGEGRLTALSVHEKSGRAYAGDIKGRLHEYSFPK